MNALDLLFVWTLAVAVWLAALAGGLILWQMLTGLMHQAERRERRRRVLARIAAPK